MKSESIENIATSIVDTIKAVLIHFHIIISAFWFILIAPSINETIIHENITVNTNIPILKLREECTNHVNVCIQYVLVWIKQYGHFVRFQ